MPSPAQLSEAQLSEAQLSEAQRRRIEAEELAHAQAQQEQLARQQREQAALAYRQEVRAALKPRPAWWPWRWLLPTLPLLAGVLYLLVVPQPPPVTDNTWGGISDSRLMERCRGEVSQQTYAREPDLRFPTPREAQGQFTPSPDGKRWDGWAARPDGTHLDFSCTYTAATDTVNAEPLQEEP
ncbi:hypothetical protein [Deinococcus fonticola]|uniref:hypothetical protein n=1 Tax=Deinococcus fonticola TaxID=2528713 RepID=UPI001075305B|nr:hypothetical protein [Deinococcus fonticola]